MNLRISVSAALAVSLASLSLNSVLKGGAWLAADLGAVIVVTGIGIVTRLSTVASVVAITLGVLLASVPLLSAPAWPPRIIALVIVALTAASVTGRRALRAFATLAVYLAALLVYLNLVFANAASYLRVVPTHHSVTLLGHMVPQAFGEFKYSPPVPDTRPVSLVAAAGIGLIAVIVDIIAVRLRRPALAGVPLLVLFCVPVATALKTFTVVETIIFMAALAGFLGLLSADGRMRLRMWGRLVTFRYVQSADEAGAGPDTRELAASGRRIGLAAMCLAVAIPIILPTVHSHALFGTSHNGRAQGGPGGLDAFLQVQHDLVERPELVLSYKTDARYPSQQYFQVFVLNYSNTRHAWLPEIPLAFGGTNPITGSVLPYQPGGQLASAAAVHTHVQMAPHQDGGPLVYLPVPYYPVDLSVPGSGWEELGGSQMILGSSQSLSDLSYTVTSRDADPTKAAIDNSNLVVPSNIQGQYSSYSGPDASRLLAIERAHTQGAVTTLQDAIDLQNWLTSKAFRYTVKPNLPKSHWLLHFLTNDRRGYCQQFAWAMAVLARLAGIPSRVVIGYTGGSPGTDGKWRVMTSDAHSWPELYFAGQGWLRFEPTPNGFDQQGTATVPAYAAGPSTASTVAGQGNTPQTHSSAGPSTGSGRKNPELNRLTQGQQGLGIGSASRVGAALLPIGIPLLILLVLGTPALTRRVTRRRRWLVASGDEGMARAAWLELTDDLADLGMPCAPGETPRALSARISRLAGFDPSAAPALTRIADAEERARYALRPVPGDGLAGDVRVVRKAAAATVGRRQRIRARLLPASTASAGRRLLERAGGLFGWLDAPWPVFRRRMRRAVDERPA